MMLAQYFDTGSDTVVTRDVHDAEELAETLNLVGGMRSGRGTPAVELSQDDGSSLVVAQTEGGSVLLWTEPLGASFHSVGEKEVGGTVVFDYLGSYTEVPASFAVAIQEAKRAALAYLESASPVTGGFTMEPD